MQTHPGADRLRGDRELSKFARGRSWIEHRLFDAMELDGAEYRVDLVARRGTGVQGFRTSVVYLPRAESGADVERALPLASTIADVHRLSRELAADPERVRALFRAGSDA